MHCESRSLATGERPASIASAFCCWRSRYLFSLTHWPHESRPAGSESYFRERSFASTSVEMQMSRQRSASASREASACLEYSTAPTDGSSSGSSSGRILVCRCAPFGRMVTGPAGPRRAPIVPSDSRSGPQMNVNGGRSNMNLFTFNGGYFNNPSRNSGLNFPPPDAIDEVRILTRNFSSEYGHNPGSQVLVASKSGSNQIHGAGWEFLRYNDLNARNFFSPTVPVVHQDQFGGQAGGPIKKDSFFIFGVYQRLINNQQAQSVQSFVPSAAQRNGDFTAQGTTLIDPVNGESARFWWAEGRRGGVASYP